MEFNIPWRVLQFEEKIEGRLCGVRDGVHSSGYGLLGRPDSWLLCLVYCRLSIVGHTSGFNAEGGMGHILSVLTHFRGLEIRERRVVLSLPSASTKERTESWAFHPGCFHSTAAALTDHPSPSLPSLHSLLIPKALAPSSFCEGMKWIENHFLCELALNPESIGFELLGRRTRSGGA